MGGFAGGLGASLLSRYWWLTPRQRPLPVGPQWWRRQRAYAEGTLADYRRGIPEGAVYTRTGLAAGVDTTGAVTFSAEDTPPITDRGMTVELAATNLVAHPSAFGNAAYSKVNVTVTDNAGPAPDGTVTADKLVATAPNGQHRLDLTTTIPNTQHAASLEADQAGYGFLWLRLGTLSAIFNLTTGAATSVGVGTTASAILLANGAWRCRVTGASPGANAVARIAVVPVASSADFVGDAASGSLLSGFQIEDGTGTGPVATSRGLPVFTEVVPVGRSSVTLTFADGSSVTAATLTPGDTFNITAAVIGAGKGVFGVSELLTRRWA